MAKWFSEFPENSEITAEDKAKRDKIVAIMARWTREMEGYSYYGSNPGIPEDDFEDVADDLMALFDMTEKK